MPSFFFDQVYAVVRQIPPGKVASYGQVAALLGHPTAPRAQSAGRWLRSREQCS